MAQNPFDEHSEAINRAKSILGRLTGTTGWLLLLVFLGLYAWSGVYTVQPSEVGLVKRFGQYVGSTGPGFHFRIPAPIEDVVIVQQRLVRTATIGFRSREGVSSTRFPVRDQEALMLTKDKNIIRVETIVQYDIVNPEDFAFQVEDSVLLMQEAAQAIIRERIATWGVDEALTENREEISDEIQTGLQQLLDDYGAGIRIVNVRLQEVTPPTDSVAAAFDDVNSAQQNKQSTILEAQRYENEILPRAKGTAQEILNGAEAYKRSRILKAEGETSRFLSVLERYRLGKEVTEARLYIETMESILPNLKKIILTKEGGGVLNLLNLESLLQGGGQ